MEPSGPKSSNIIQLSVADSQQAPSANETVSTGSVADNSSSKADARMTLLSCCLLDNMLSLGQTELVHSRIPKALVNADNETASTLPSFVAAMPARVA